jgi:hypothetical protein
LTIESNDGGVVQTVSLKSRLTKLENTARARGVFNVAKQTDLQRRRRSARAADANRRAIRREWEIQLAVRPYSVRH